MFYPRTVATNRFNKSSPEVGKVNAPLSVFDDASTISATTYTFSGFENILKIFLINDII